MRIWHQSENLSFSVVCALELPGPGLHRAITRSFYTELWPTLLGGVGVGGLGCHMVLRIEPFICFLGPLYEYPSTYLFWF